MQIKTPRTEIRNFTPGDAMDLFEILGDAKTMENCEPAYTLEKTEAFLSNFCIDRHGAVAAGHRESGKVIGYILLHEMNKGVYEMGWIFNRHFWGQGYACEACRALMDYTFGELKAHKAFAETIDTGKSVRLMQKLGMASEGVQRSQVRDAHGKWTDVYRYGLLKEDWHRLKNARN